MDLTDNKRNYSIDILRAISMAAIVAIHSFSRMANEFNDDSLKFMNGYIQITNFAVPVFFIISGFVLTERLKRIQKHKLKYTVNKAWKIYKLFLVWSVIFLIFKHDFNVKTIYWSVYNISLLKFFFGSGFSEHLWFLPVLSAGYFVIYITSKYYNNFILILIIITLYAFFGLFLGNYHQLFNLISISNNNYFVGISFCLLGVFLANNKTTLNKYRNYSILFVCVGFISIFFESMFLFNTSDVIRPDFLVGTFFLFSWNFLST